MGNVLAIYRLFYKHVSFCETTERYPTLKTCHLVPSPSFTLSDGRTVERAPTEMIYMDWLFPMEGVRYRLETQGDYVILSPEQVKGGERSFDFLEANSSPLLYQFQRNRIAQSVYPGQEVSPLRKALSALLLLIC